MKSEVSKLSMYALPSNRTLYNASSTMKPRSLFARASLYSGGRDGVRETRGFWRIRSSALALGWLCLPLTSAPGTGQTLDTFDPKLDAPVYALALQSGGRIV